MQIMVVAGARPQFMKAAPVIRALKAQGFDARLVHTGQHFDAAMSDIFFEELGLPEPAVNLGVAGGGHGAMTGRMLERLEASMIVDRPDMVVVIGDTNSTLAAGLAAAKLHIPVAHVESGLRSRDMSMPEEVNRRVVDHISDLLFCPTGQAIRNLELENPYGRILLTGDVSYDCILDLIERARVSSRILERLALTAGAYALATVHRPATTECTSALSAVIDWLRDQASRAPVVLPVHPRMRAALERSGLDTTGLILINPVGPLDMQALLAGCTEVFTDSGGLQKEAYFHRKPCVTLRDTTEWTETVEAGWNRLWTQNGYKQRREIDEYGAGDAAVRMADAVRGFLGG